MKSLSTLFLSTVLVSLTSSCQSPLPASKNMVRSNLTHGQVQLTLKKNQTTKVQVIEAFGAPNITTSDAGGREVWTYQKHASITQSSSSSSFATIILLGSQQSASGFETSSRTMTLIIKFDENDKVVDFKSRSSSF
ncbi:hypothetical protein [Aliikangiella sp. IMCC44359]|uniref:hypothetical protein n=1 Tax=Aliikangiella sp. IMCC44359 TaxID=3459125 RepID=UPI00403B146C